MSGPASLAAPRFEGSYRPEALSDAAVMECKICWTPYDPAVGDETRSILPGTAFTALPADWKCPNCDGAREQFMVLDDPGIAADPRARAATLVAAFREIEAGRMRGTPFSNASLSVQAVGFRAWEGAILGVLITPWMMSLVMMPGTGDWPAARTGSVTIHGFPSGDYEFLSAERPECGPYRSCSLFSPMAEFASQLHAVEVGEAVIAQLFRAENRPADTDRNADIRAEAEAQAAASASAAARAGVEARVPAARIDAAPTRRTLISGGLAGPAA